MVVRCMEREKRRQLTRQAKGIPEPYADRRSKLAQAQSQSKMEMSVQHPPPASGQRTKVQKNEGGWIPQWKRDPKQVWQDAKVAGGQMGKGLTDAVKGWKPSFPATVPLLGKGPKGVGAVGGTKVPLPMR